MWSVFAVGYDGPTGQSSDCTQPRSRVLVLDEMTVN